MTIRLIIMTLTMLALAACGNGDAVRKPVPRRYAYHRVELPDTVMAPAKDFPAYLPVNAAAEVSSERPGWLTVAYPGLNAAFHITYTATTPADVTEILANRHQRMSLNSGDHPVELMQMQNEAGLSVIATRTEGIATPLQFIATDHRSMVVSGALYLSDPGAPEAVDSMRPIIDALQRDLNAALDSLRPL